jgi:RHS repeat-associated protein
VRTVTSGPITQTDFGYTGQRALGMGLMDYHARMYDSYITQFSQPDSIIPSLANPQSFNRYSYVLNRSINFNDPTGHKDCSEIDENGQCMSEADQIKSAILQLNNQLKKQVDNGKITDLEAFAELAEYTASLTPDCVKCFINNLGAVVTGFDQGNYVTNEFGHHQSEYYEKSLPLGQTGFADIFQDPQSAVNNGGGDQPFHFWFYVQVGYENGKAIGDFGVYLHETFLGKPAGMSLQDQYLGYEGVKLGMALRNGDISLTEVGQYIRGTLAPGTNTALYYKNLYQQIQKIQPSEPMWP